MRWLNPIFWIGLIFGHLFGFLGWCALSAERGAMAAERFWRNR